MASSKFQELRGLFLEYEGLSDNIAFCDEMIRSGAGEEDTLSKDRQRVTEIEEIIEVLLSQ